MCGTYNFTINQGSDFSLLATYKDSTGTPVNLTGMTLASKARANKEETEIFSFSFTLADQNTNAGEFYMTLSNSISSAVDCSIVSKFFYDVELTNGSNITRLFQGIVTLSREITR